MSENFWEQIPRGKTDPPMLMWDLSASAASSRPTAYRGNIFPAPTAPRRNSWMPLPKKFSTVPAGRGRVRSSFFSSTCWLGLKLGGVLHGYGKEVSVELGGFTDTDGNAMQPAVLRVRTPDRVLWPYPIALSPDLLLFRPVEHPRRRCRNPPTPG